MKNTLFSQIVIRSLFLITVGASGQTAVVSATAAEQHQSAARNVAKQIIHAVHGNPETSPRNATEERSMLVREIERTEKTTELWTREAAETIEGWSRAVESKGVRAVSSVRCYAGGCVVDMRYDDDGAHMRTEHALHPAMGTAPWSGVTILTGPEYHDDGTVTNSWILLRPERTY